ncbi:unnamed protein product [Rangifer tarandus platyrhynchus]|uniref:Uncharacterized protein n=2 Tax=Rangifer tarandus platyrhynchus TaxID=3082113 RepID=A0ABN8YSL2_RANTA|nr:unnamed protein product [Rangifer tarandus platyrhynchus]
MFQLLQTLSLFWASLVAQMVKNLPANAGDPGSIPGSGRCPEEGNGSPLQYPVFLPGESHGQRSLAGYSPWGRKELDMPERLNTTPTSYLKGKRKLSDENCHLPSLFRTNLLP